MIFKCGCSILLALSSARNSDTLMTYTVDVFGMRAQVPVADHDVALVTDLASFASLVVKGNLLGDALRTRHLRRRHVTC